MPVGGCQVVTPIKVSYNFKNKTGGVPVGAEISHLPMYCTLNKRGRGLDITPINALYN